MKNVKYAFVEQNQALFMESVVESFGLEHITQKDMESFFLNFSKMAYFDTGLMPVDGSGMLSIRTAGPHTQIGYQHKPGMYYINWGKYEGDPSAQKIYVAQPWRIVIADIYNGNLLGARTFYSPVPIQHPSQPLYHVNLPNINCKGYRGNGVGWICLYHTHEIAHLPFSEKVAHILDRCSGTEAYNDQNMSETDGPRFYQEHGKPIHLWDPSTWQAYSDANGVDWTLDPELWIPVLVAGRDDQGKHTKNGIPLTYADALLGNYQGYYTDPIMPKPVNILTRGDLAMQKKTLVDWFKQAYNAAATEGTAVTKLNSFTAAEAFRSDSAYGVTTSTEEEEYDEDEQHEEDPDSAF